MEKQVENRFVRIEKILEKVVQANNETAQINKDTALLARENQKRLGLLLSKME